jgi:nitrogen regulatory protein PII
MKIIQKHAYIGEHGDGGIVLYPVLLLINIRNGEPDEVVL